MDKFYNRAAFRAEGNPPYVWGFDLLETGENACEALDGAGIGGLYEVIGAIIAKEGAGCSAEAIEDCIVRGTAEAFRPLVRPVLDLGTLMKAWADCGDEGFWLIGDFKKLGDPTPFVPWWAAAN